MIIDTHSHYDDPRLLQDLPILLPKMRESGVEKIITCGVDVQSSEKLIGLCADNEMLYCAVGVYPHETHLLREDTITRLENLCRNKKVVAIGEIGLDYHYNTASKEVQLLWCERFLKLANELNLPVTFHIRESTADSLALLKKHRPRGAAHCFTGSPETAKELTDIGMLVGISGVATFKNAKTVLRVIEQTPLEYLLLETDAPYMSPVPKRGKINRSDYIVYIAEKVAEVKGISVKEVLKVTRENALSLFDKLKGAKSE